MPFENYVLTPREERTRRERAHDGFSIADFFGKDYVFRQAHTSDRMIVIRPWKTFDEIMKPKRISGRGWIVFGHKPLEKKRGPDLVGILKNRMKTSRKDAETLVNELFKELDQIAGERGAEPFSQNEKEQLVLAITKTARNIIKEAFKK